MKKQNTFTDLLREYEEQASNRTPQTETAYTTALQDLATATSYSVLKKCIQVSHNPTLVKTKQELTRDLYNLDNIAYSSENAYTTKFNANGDEVETIADKDIYTAFNSLCSQSLGDGIDLVNTAIIAIMEETKKATERKKERQNNLKNTAYQLRFTRGRKHRKALIKEVNNLKNQIDNTCFMEDEYYLRKLKRKIYIDLADSENCWEYVITTPIQQVFKAVRRSIMQYQSTKINQNGYTYLEDMTTDNETGISETIYRRFGKYADIGGAVTNFNGKEIAYTTDQQTVQDIDTLIEKLNLSTQQTKILQLRLRGYGYKVIAKYLGVRQDSVTKQIKRMREKATAAGLQPDTI